MNIPSIVRDTAVHTADEKLLGVAKRIYVDTIEDADLRSLHPVILMVVDFEIGDDLYIPLEYVQDTAVSPLHLNKTMKKVQTETLSRLPQFIVNGTYVEHQLN